MNGNLRVKKKQLDEISFDRLKTTESKENSDNLLGNVTEIIGLNYITGLGWQ